MFKRREKIFTPTRKPNFNHPAYSVPFILTLKTANTQIRFALAATLNKPNYIIPTKLKQVNEIQPTKMAVVFKVKLSDLHKSSSRSKAAY